MNKRNLSERDICTKLIPPALEQAGWDIATQVREGFSLTEGRVIVRGKLHTRARHKRADYVLFYKPNIPIAIIEAKDNKHSIGDGMQQALAERNYSLDCKPPYEEMVEHCSPEELMVEYQQLTEQIATAQQALKSELLAALEGRA